MNGTDQSNMEGKNRLVITEAFACARRRARTHTRARTHGSSHRHVTIQAFVCMLAQTGLYKAMFCSVIVLQHVESSL